MLLKAASLYRTSFQGLSPQTWLLSLVMLINRSGTMVVPFMTLYLTSEEMGRSLTDAGFVMALFGLGSIVGAFIGGRLSDRIGFYNVQLVTLFCGGLLFIVLGQLRSFPLICVFTFILSMVNEAFRPANSSAIAVYSKPENRTRSYSLNRLAINLGWAIGASAGGLIAAYNYELLFWVDGFTNIVAAALLLIFLNPSRQTGKSQAKESPVITASAYRDKTYLFFIVLTALFASCFFQLFTTIPKYLRDNLHLTEDFIGYVMALNGLIIVFFEMVLVYVMEQKKRDIHYITAGVIICALAFFSMLLPIPARAVTLIMILLITVGEIAAMPFMNSFWISRSSEVNRGQYAALYTIAWGTGQTAGPYISSLIAENAGFDVMFMALGMVLLLSAAGYYSLRSTYSGAQSA